MKQKLQIQMTVIPNQPYHFILNNSQYQSMPVEALVC